MHCALGVAPDSIHLVVVVIIDVTVVIVVVVVVSTHQLYLGSSLHIFEPNPAPAALLQGLQQSQTHGARLQSLIKVSKFQQGFLGTCWLNRLGNWKFKLFLLYLPKTFRILLQILG